MKTMHLGDEGREEDHHHQHHQHSMHVCRLCLIFFFFLSVFILQRIALYIRSISISIELESFFFRLGFFQLDGT